MIYKAKIAYVVRTQGFINLNNFWRTQNLAFGRTDTFSYDPTHSFINETPDRPKLLLIRSIIIEKNFLDEI